MSTSFSIAIDIMRKKMCSHNYSDFIGTLSILVIYKSLAEEYMVQHEEFKVAKKNNKNDH